MKRTVLVAIVASMILAACGGSGNGAPAVNQALVANVPEVANAPRTNKPADKPANKPAENRPAPVVFRNVTREVPQGWFRLNKDGQSEVLGHTKLKAAKPATFEFVYGVSRTKEPGPTEGKEEWDKWAHDATCAMLYFIDNKKVDPAAAVKDNADKVAAGAPEPKTEGDIAWTALQGGEIVLAALNLSHGTYLVVGVVLDTANVEAHTQTIVQWAQGIKADNAAD